MAKEKPHALVIGGAGFVGKRLLELLQQDGRYQLSCFDVRESGLSGVTAHVGDLRVVDQVEKAVQGKEVVFHCAAVTPTRENDKNKSLMWGVNVDGTKNVIAACQKHRVPKLVFTSSSSVVFEGKNLLNVDETWPYAVQPMDYYSETKAAAEQMVLQANGQQGLATCALRPASVFGEGDPLFVPSLVTNARQGKNKYYIGSGQNLTDFTYVGSIANAHIQAADALDPGSKVAGSAYFITNDEPKLFWGFCGDVLEGLGYARPYIGLPWLLIYLIALLLHYVIGPLMKPIKPLSTDLTPLKVTLASSTRTFSCAKAKRDFGYKPVVDMQEALKRTLSSFAHLKNAKKA